MSGSTGSSFGGPGPSGGTSFSGPGPSAGTSSSVPSAASVSGTAWTNSQKLVALQQLVAEVQSGDPGVMDNATGHWFGVYQGILDLNNALALARNRIVSGPGSWTGESATAFSGNVDQFLSTSAAIATQAQTVSLHLGQARDALGNARGGLSGPESFLRLYESLGSPPLDVSTGAVPGYVQDALTASLDTAYQEALAARETISTGYASASAAIGAVVTPPPIGTVGGGAIPLDTPPPATEVVGEVPPTGRPEPLLVGDGVSGGVEGPLPETRARGEREHVPPVSGGVEGAAGPTAGGRAPMSGRDESPAGHASFGSAASDSGIVGGIAEPVAPNRRGGGGPVGKDGVFGGEPIPITGGAHIPSSAGTVRGSRTNVGDAARAASGAGRLQPELPFAVGAVGATGTPAEKPSSPSAHARAERHHDGDDGVLGGWSARHVSASVPGGADTRLPPHSSAFPDGVTALPVGAPPVISHHAVHRGSEPPLVDAQTTTSGGSATQPGRPTTQPAPLIRADTPPTPPHTSQGTRVVGALPDASGRGNAIPLTSASPGPSAFAPSPAAATTPPPGGPPPGMATAAGIGQADDQLLAVGGPVAPQPIPPPSPPSSANPVPGRHRSHGLLRRRRPDAS